MKTTSPTSPHSLRQTLRSLDWVIIAVSSMLACFSNYYGVYDWQTQVQLAGFHGVFLCLSLITPLQASLWKRRCYVGVCIAVFVIAAVCNFRFELLMYWTIAKSCLLIPLREVIAATLLLGVGYLAGLTWSLPQRIDRTLEMIAKQGVTEYFAPVKLMFNHFVFYLGASSFAIVVGYLMLAERKSRLRSEALTQEVEQLAATLERNRIARDIHDVLGHSLTALGIQLEVAQKLRESNPNQALQSLDTAKLLADDCLREVRSTLHTLHRPSFDLQQSITSKLEQIQQQQSCQIEVHLDFPPLPLSMSHHLYCVMQEGLMNIQKHANATCVVVRSHFSHEEVMIELIDDGNGFQPDAPHSGFGLRGMQERVQLLGGQLLIKTAPEQGTVIHVAIPR